MVNERSVRLSELLRAPKSGFLYRYDFGDGWEHHILLEKILPKPLGKRGPAPRCTGGRRACPPEDCGGPWGYSNLLDALANPRHPERAHYLEWVGGSFNPDAFKVPD